MVMQMILSFDVGTKNLSLCKLDNQKEIHEWQLINIGSVNAESLCNRLDSINGLMNDVKLVVIEKQIRANIKMIRMSTMLETWCFMRKMQKGMKVILCPAAKRLEFIGYTRDSGLTKGRQYRARKTACVEYAKDVLCGSPWLEHLESSSKKDDLADCLCQALVYVQ